MSKEMVINVKERDECRVAVVEDGQLEELYMERVSLNTHVGNVYMGKIVNVEPSIQAAFVDFGDAKNGFLHISDIHPRYFMYSDAKERMGRRKSMDERPPIQQVLKRGQELLVQVTKEGIRAKGPALTTYVSVPGKYLVMMPWMDRVGVSQKIEDEDERIRLKAVLKGIEKPKDVGFIIRTAGLKATKKDVQSDLNYLSRLWESIQRKMKKGNVPFEIYQESDLVIRAVRDIFESKVRKIICDSESVAVKVRDFLAIAQPRFKRRVTYYDGNTPLFYKYGIESEIEKIQSSRVELKSGGSIVIEQTEAMVTVDVNSGRYRRQEDAERTALNINIEAAKEIARQLRLRDLGGLIVCDFIDMREAVNRREVEKEFRLAVKGDRARYRVLKMSAFGLIEMTRQRMRPSLQLSTYYECPHCNGSGYVKTDESISLEVMRLVSLAMAKDDVYKVEVSVSLPVASYLNNNKRGDLAECENSMKKTITVKADPQIHGAHFNIDCFDERGKKIEFNAK